jgi:hypothetical protein
MCISIGLESLTFKAGFNSSEGSGFESRHVLFFDLGASFLDSCMLLLSIFFRRFAPVLYFPKGMVPSGRFCGSIDVFEKFRCSTMGQVLTR